jgi:hypothetical protein
VSLAINLGMARAQAGTAEEAKQAIAEAHEEAKAALAELRDLIRGLHPAVLEDRGLDAALSGVAARMPIPVRLTVDLPRRPAPVIEAVAYFVVSEGLANIVKHSQATEAAVFVQRAGNRLHVIVTDDGVGGADPAGAPAWPAWPSAPPPSTEPSKSTARPAGRPSSPWTCHATANRPRRTSQPRAEGGAWPLDLAPQRRPHHRRDRRLRLLRHRPGGGPARGPTPMSAVPTRIVTVTAPVTALNVQSYGAPIKVTTVPGGPVQIAESIVFGSGDGGPPTVTDTDSHGQLTLAAPACANSDCSVGFSVTVPSGVTVTAAASGGGVTVDGTGAADIDSGGGPVYAAGITGPLTVNAEGGGVTVNNATTRTWTLAAGR